MTRYALDPAGITAEGLHRYRHLMRFPWYGIKAIALTLVVFPPLAFSGSPAEQSTSNPVSEAATPSKDADAFSIGDGLATHFHYLDQKWVNIFWDEAGGGAIEPVGNHLLVVTPWGRMALVRADGKVTPLQGRVPMNLEGLKSHPDSADLRIDRFRVADILLKQHGEWSWELFVTHHWFTGECIRFRLSSAPLLWHGASVAVSPSWRTIFDAEPCVAVDNPDLHEAGGRMLTDEQDHLLAVIGHHGMMEVSQDPDSHLGKMVRIRIETGETKVLSLGLRNPQGFARDADGTLWETEHGPMGGDELNLLEPGVNYGWPNVSYGIGYGGRWFRHIPVDWTGRHPAFARPAFAWVPSITTSAMIVNDEQQFPLWKDDLLIGSLGGKTKGVSIWRVRRNGTHVQYVERIKVGYRVRDLTRMPDGRIAALADGGSRGGRVYFLSLSSKYCTDKARQQRLVYTIGCSP